eukprot:Clim_evm18s109 gene=Clim_evmTU18s109
MSINTARIVPGGVIPNPGENFAYHHGGVDFTIQSKSDKHSKLEGTGTCMVSNQRFVFLAEKPKHGMSSFEVYLRNLSDYDIEQPIFGANKFVSDCKIAPGQTQEPRINGDIARLNMSFKNGGATEFTAVFFRVISTPAAAGSRPTGQPQAPPPWNHGQQPPQGYGPPPGGMPAPGFGQAATGYGYAQPPPGYGQPMPPPPQQSGADGYSMPPAGAYGAPPPQQQQGPPPPYK